MPLFYWRSLLAHRNAVTLTENFEYELSRTDGFPDTIIKLTIKIIINYQRPHWPHEVISITHNILWKSHADRSAKFGFSPQNNFANICERHVIFWSVRDCPGTLWPFVTWSAQATARVVTMTSISLLRLDEWKTALGHPGQSESVTIARWRHEETAIVFRDLEARSWTAGWSARNRMAN